MDEKMLGPRYPFSDRCREAEAEYPPFLRLRDWSFARDVRDTDPLVP
jgi:hypothetical protein